MRNATEGETQLKTKSKTEARAPNKIKFIKYGTHNYFFDVMHCKHRSIFINQKSNELWGLIFSIFILIIFSLALRHAHVLDRKEHCPGNFESQKLCQLKSKRYG